MAEVIGPTLALLDASCRIGRSLQNAYRIYQKNGDELETLLQKYESLRHALQSLHLDQDSSSRMMRRALEPLRDYFCSAKEGLMKMNNLVSRGQHSLLALWKVDRFSEEIASLLHRFGEAVSRLLELDSFSRLRSDNSTIEIQLKGIKTALSSRPSFREEAMLAFKDLLLHMQPRTASDLENVELKAVREATFACVEETGNREPVAELFHDDELEQKISDAYDRMHNISGEIRAASYPRELSAEVNRFMNVFQTPWLLNPHSDIEILYEKDMFGRESRKEIGVGSSRIVYEAKVRAKNDSESLGFRPAAVKVMHQALMNNVVKAEFLREVEVLSEVSHPCIVEFLGAYWPLDQQDGHAAVIATELMTGNLEKLRNKFGTKESLLKILLDIAEGLEYLHDLGIVHMDVKPQNVFVRLDESGVVTGRGKLADVSVSCRKRFHASQQLEVSTKGVAGTLICMAPELREGSSKARPACDVWSFGMTAFQIARNNFAYAWASHPIDGDGESTISSILYDNTADQSYSIDDEDLRRLVRDCLQSDPLARPSIREVRVDLLCMTLGIGPDTARSLRGKSAQVLYWEGVGKLFGIYGFSADAELSWQLLCIATELGFARSRMTLDLCFSDRETLYSREHIFERLSQHDTSIDLQFLLGDCYIYDIGTRKDVESAIQIFTNASELGDAFAQNNLGWCYQHGIGVEKNAARAVSLYQQAADAGNAAAQKNLGWCYEHGIGVKKDEARAVTLYQQAADAGDAAAKNSLRRCCEHGIGVEKNAARAESLYQQAADAGNASAQRSLGWRYEHGIGVKKDEARAVTLYQQAADAGNAAAQNNLGWCYQHGIGVKKDEARAVSLYQQAADAGNASAQRNLGWCHERGIGVKKNVAEPVSLYQQAADAGNASAQRSLGWRYEHGIGVKKDEARAVTLYQQAADAGNAAAQNNLGWCYQHGIGVEKNTARAVSLYQQAADAGNASAQRSLGWCYQHGIGVKKNVAEPVSLYQQAADAGDASAQRSLGWRYEHGIGVKKDEARAVTLYQQAADAGNAAAQNNLGWCHERGIGAERDPTLAVSLHQQLADAEDGVAEPSTFDADLENRLPSIVGSPSASNPAQNRPRRYDSEASSTPEPSLRDILLHMKERFFMSHTGFLLFSCSEANCPDSLRASILSLSAQYFGGISSMLEKLKCRGTIWALWLDCCIDSDILRIAEELTRYNLTGHLYSPLEFITNDDLSDDVVDEARKRWSVRVEISREVTSFCEESISECIWGHEYVILTGKTDALYSLGSLLSLSEVVVSEPLRSQQSHRKLKLIARMVRETVQGMTQSDTGRDVVSLRDLRLQLSEVRAYPLIKKHRNRSPSEFAKALPACQVNQETISRLRLAFEDNTSVAVNLETPKEEELLFIGCKTHADASVCDDVAVLRKIARDGIIWNGQLLCPYCQVGPLPEHNSIQAQPVIVSKRTIECLTGLGSRIVGSLAGVDEDLQELDFWTSEVEYNVSFRRLKSDAAVSVLLLGGHWRAVPEFDGQVLVENCSNWLSSCSPTLQNDNDLCSGNVIYKNYFDHLTVAKALIPKYFDDDREVLQFGCDLYDIGCVRDQLPIQEDYLVSMLRLWGKLRNGRSSLRPPAAPGDVVQPTPIDFTHGIVINQFIYL